jgi:hypothetical protein
MEENASNWILELEEALLDEVSYFLVADPVDKLFRTPICTLRTPICML